MPAMRAATVPSVLLLVLLPLAALGGDREVFFPEAVLFEQFPREVARNGMQPFAVTLKPGYHTPILVVTGPDGRSRYIEAARSLPGRKYEFEVEYGEQPGAYRVELVVDSRRGDTTAA